MCGEAPDSTGNDFAPALLRRRLLLLSPALRRLMLIIGSGGHAALHQACGAAPNSAGNPTGPKIASEKSVFPMRRCLVLERLIRLRLASKFPVPSHDLFQLPKILILIKIRGGICSNYRKR